MTEPTISLYIDGDWRGDMIAGKFPRRQPMAPPDIPELTPASFIQLDWDPSGLGMVSVLLDGVWIMRRHWSPADGFFRATRRWRHPYTGYSPYPSWKPDQGIRFELELRPGETDHAL